MAVKKYRASRLLNNFLKLLGSIYLKALFDYRLNISGLKGIKPPYIVLANHTNFWDPFLLSMGIPVPVYFVASDAYFRNPLLRQLLKLVGAIPKTKLVSDLSSAHAIMDVVKNSGVIGIFPEGRRNWDGKTLPLIYPTAKLIKRLGIPVISAVLKGACLSMPRWASSHRKGFLEITYSEVLDGQEILDLTTEEIFERISESLSYDEYEYQQEHMNPYPGKNPAEKLELFLFCCPGCKCTNSLKSEGALFRCGNCGYQVRYNDYGYFETEGTGLYYDNPRDWNRWQLEYFDKLLVERSTSDASAPFIEDHAVVMRTGQRTGSLKSRTEGGTLSIFSDRLEYRVGCNLIDSFPIGRISGANIQFNNQLEFICRKTIYRFSKDNGTMPAYKWVKAIETVKRLGK